MDKAIIDALRTKSPFGLAGDVNAEFTKLKKEKRFNEAIDLMQSWIDQYPFECRPLDKARVADLIQRHRSYDEAVVIFKSIISDADNEKNELKKQSEIIIPTLRRWRSAAKRAGVQVDVEFCEELMRQADIGLPLARALEEKKRIYRLLAVPHVGRVYVGWSAASSVEEACTSLHMQAWQTNSQEFLALVERHFSTPVPECRCWCRLIFEFDFEREPWRLNQTVAPMRY